MNLQAIKEIYLQQNLLHYIDPNVFATAKELVIVNLSHNKLNHVDIGNGSEYLFKYCSKIEEINLSHNNISKIYEDWGVSTVLLKTLNLSNNSFQNILVSNYIYILTNYHYI